MKRQTLSRRSFIKTGLIWSPIVFSAGLQGSVKHAALNPAVISWMRRVEANGGKYTSRSVVANDVVSKMLPSIGTKLLRWNTYTGGDLNACEVPMGNALGTSTDSLHAFVAGDYSETTGLTGDGTTKWNGTGFIPSVHWASDNDCGMGVYMRTTNGSAQNTMGAFVAGAIAALTASFSGATSSGFLFSQVATEFATVADAVGTGHYLVSRTASNSLVLYRNGVSIASTATPTGGRAGVNTEIAVHAILINSVPSGFNSRSFGGYHITKGLTAAEVEIAYNAFQAGNRVLGRQV